MVKIKIHECELKTQQRSADAIVAGKEPGKVLALRYDIELPQGCDVQDRLGDILQGVQKVTLEALKAEKLISDDSKVDDAITTKQREALFNRW